MLTRSGSSFASRVAGSILRTLGMDELLARMRAALRHQLQVQGERPVFRSGDLSVDLVRRIVKVGEREVKLSPKEYDILEQLAIHAGKVLTHRQILTALWGPAHATDTQYLRVYIGHLRRKLGPAASRLQTEAGIDDTEMNRTFNNGIGMVLLVPARQVAAVTQTLTSLGEQVHAIGTVVPRASGAAVQLVG